MRCLFARKLRLKPSIVALFVLLTVPGFLTIVGLTYLSNDRIARANANELVERFRTEAVEKIENLFDPIRSLTRSAAVVGDEQPGFYADNRSLKYLLTILMHSERVVSVYVALQDGSFRQARRIDPNIEIQGKLPPAGVKYAYRWIEPAKNMPPVDHYLFLDADQREIGRSDQTTTYDPRTRYWYRHTVAERTLVTTEPDVFAALGLIGFTVAAPFASHGNILGVAAADITLDGLSEYLTDSKISPGTSSYILDRQGVVVANSERAKTYSDDHGRVSLQHITDLDNQLAAIAFGSHPRHSEGTYSFDQLGQEYLASYSALPPQLGNGWQLFIVTPLRDFTAAFEAHNQRLLYFG